MKYSVTKRKVDSLPIIYKLQEILSKTGSQRETTVGFPPNRKTKTGVGLSKTQQYKREAKARSWSSLTLIPNKHPKRIVL